MVVGKINMVVVVYSFTPRVPLFLAPISSKRLLQRLAYPTQKRPPKKHSASGERFPKYFVLVSELTGVKNMRIRDRVYGAVLSCVCGFFLA